MYESPVCTVSSFVDGTRQWGSLPARSGGDLDGYLSVIVLFDYPFDSDALDEALFSLAVQDWNRIEVIVALPDCGVSVHREMESEILAQSWPALTRAKVVSVSTPSGRALSPDLINAGFSHATGRYVALLHHRDLIYHHTYTTLISRLECSEAVSAFGGIREARHARGLRHWQVLTKQAVRTGASRLGYLADGSAPIHCFVADRSRLSADYLHVYNPASSLATTINLLRLALHPESDFSHATTPLCEVRYFPQAASQAVEGGDGRLLSLDSLINSLECGDLILRDTAISPNVLLAEAMKALVP